MENNNTNKVPRKVAKVKQEGDKPQGEEMGMVLKPNENAAIVELAAPIDAIVKQVDLFQDLKAKLLRKEDYQQIQGKNFIKKSGWRKFALAFNISDEILKENRVEYMTPSKSSEMYFSWEVTVKATAPNGRYSVATASCASNEKHFSHAEHDVRATAATRAKNRAISDLIGGGEVSAEEISDEAPGGFQGPKRATPVSRPAVQNPNEPMSDKQRAMIFATLKRLGKDKDWLEAKTKTPIEGMTKGYASGIIDQLVKLEIENRKPAYDLPIVQVDDEPELGGHEEDHEVERARQEREFYGEA